MEFSRKSMIGFSTGAIAYPDFGFALQALREHDIRVVEISALRMPEWEPLMLALDELDLSAFDFVSIHLPSAMNAENERIVARDARAILERKLPLILHPDAIVDFGVWRELGPLICLENMDKRKPIGRTEAELSSIFKKLPEARLCFDIGHARQIDPTMTEAYSILKAYRDSIVQLHVSEVNSRSKHDSLSYATIQSFREVAHMVPLSVPVILETPVSVQEMSNEINKANFALAHAAASDLVA